MAGNGGENVTRARLTRSPSSCNFAIGMHQPAITYRREHRGKRDFRTQHPRSQIALAHRNRMPRPESNGFEGAAILAQRDFTLRAAVKIIENRFGDTPLRDLPKVGDVHHPRGFQSARHPHCDSRRIISDFP